MTKTKTGVEPVAGRITELENAFRAYVGGVPGLSVHVVGHVSGNDALVHPVAGFEVRLVSADGGKVSLYVSSAYGELRRWHKGEEEEGKSRGIRELFRVRLADEFSWGDSVFPTAQGLAHDLLGYMQYCLDAAV